MKLQWKNKEEFGIQYIHHVEDEDIGEDIVLIRKQFWNFLRKKQRNKRFSNFKKDRNKKEASNDVLRCYKCNKTGYIKGIKDSQTSRRIETRKKRVMMSLDVTSATKQDTSR